MGIKFETEKSDQTKLIRYFGFDSSVFQYIFSIVFLEVRYFGMVLGFKVAVSQLTEISNIFSIYVYMLTLPDIESFVSMYYYGSIK